ncbi:MAG: PQQ-binding-like beta-propeller repeat protein [Planctomycetota bacterium]
MASSSESSPKRGPNHPRRAILGLIVGGSLIALLQWLAPYTDHQFANMGCFAIGLMTSLVVLYQLHRWARSNGYGNRVLVVASLVLLTAIFGFRFDGFSGELVPQFKFRFAEPEHELRQLSGEAVNPAPVSTSQESETLAVVDEPSSSGFLGEQRTGVIAERDFGIPTNTNDLEVVWDQGIGSGWSSFAVASGRAVTLEQRDDMDCLTCYDLDSGDLLWMQSHQAMHGHPMGGTGPRSTPTIHEGKVYAQDAEGLVWCVDLISGKSVWSVDLLELAGWTQVDSEAAITWGRSGSPLIVDGLCVVPFGGPEANMTTGRSLIALDAQTGDVRWTAGEDQISYASPALFTLAGKRQIVIVNEMTITGHAIEDGKVLWDFVWPGQSSGGANCAMAMQANDDSFVIGKGYGGGSALVKVTVDDEGNFSATENWASSRFLKTKFTHACIDGDIAYAISNGSLEAIQLSSSEQRWKQPRPSRLGQGQILLVEDVIVAQAEAGELVFVKADPNEYLEIARFPALSDKTWNVPTIAGRYLLVRNDRQAICYRLPSREE